jgi:hypothetical protein
MDVSRETAAQASSDEQPASFALAAGRRLGEYRVRERKGARLLDLAIAAGKAHMIAMDARKATPDDASVFGEAWLRGALEVMEPEGLVLSP